MGAGSKAYNAPLRSRVPDPLGRLGDGCRSGDRNRRFPRLSGSPLGSGVAAGWLLGFALVAGIVGLVALDRHVTYFLRSESRTQPSRFQAFGAHGSILGIVGFAMITAFLAGVGLDA